MKTMLWTIMLSAISLNVFAVDYLANVKQTLESDYEFRCHSISEDMYNCHSKDSKLVAVKIQRKALRDGYEIKFIPVNNSKAQLMTIGKDKFYWGKTITTNLMNEIKSGHQLDCQEPASIAFGEGYVYRPWWQDVIVADCIGEMAEGINVRVNLGADGHFIKNIKLREKSY